MGRDLILTGLPRSGTTLACRLLGQCAQTVALAEPMDVDGIPSSSTDDAVNHVIAWLVATRRSILETGAAPSKVGQGGLVDNPFSPNNGSGPRVLQVSEGILQLEGPIPPGFRLVVKHNAAFTALLPQLARRVQTVAIIRHPMAVLASWASLSLPVSQGRLPAGERLDPLLASRLRAEPDVLRRQVAILCWFFERFRDLPPGAVIRYEDLTATHGTALFDAAGIAPVRRGDPLQDRNTLPQCPLARLPRLAEALEAQGGAWTQWYPSSSIAPVLASMGVT